MIDCTARTLLDDVDVIGEIVFGNRLFSAPFAIGEQLIDVLASVAERLIVLFREPVRDVFRKCRRSGRWSH
ncbi:hypothetical protein [Saliphagus infecundisoli]|uniref:Uncharacterized protein n=1 Tax=Saliphagus infecundisoli TaxID=1849069 RepID=A0ABD5QHS1_9EURY|nr:hypothetical protein [Saliphagus infecundisoli]